MNRKPHNPTPHTHTPRRAFTLVEMMVALGATMLLALFIQQVFTSLAAATSMGKSTSSVIQNARMIPSQVLADADAMVDSDGNGVLVIVNRLIQNVQLSAEDPAQFNFRADQVMWIREIRTLIPTFNQQNSYQQGAVTDHFPVVRVWYGHALRTQPDGALLPGANADLGFAPNQYAANWTLARQTLFFKPTFGGIVCSSGSWFNAPVKGYNAGNPEDPAFLPPGYNVHNPNPAQNQAPLYMAIATIAQHGFDTTVTNFGQMVGDDSSAAVAGDEPYMTLWQQNTGSDAQSYARRAYQYTYAIERLRINPNPQPPYYAWQVGQMHPFLTDNVVDFQVQFAGDYAAPLGELDRFDHDGDATTPEVIRWYDIDDFPLTAAAAFDDPTTATTDGATKPIYDANPVYDNTTTSTIDPVPHADAAFIFRHGPVAATNWPAFLRFRYRVIDPKGNLSGADGLPGKPFELIIPVK